MAYRLVELKFQSPLHLGKAGIGMESVENYARSDTLFGALCHAWAVVYGSEDLAEVLHRFKSGDPPFKITSAFPFSGYAYYLPRPLVQANLRGDSGENDIKDLRKLDFLPFEMFNQWVRGEEVDAGSVREVKEDLSGALVYHMVPRVQLDRVTSASGLFHACMMVFGENAGLYCLVDIIEEDISDKLEGAFAWLGETGLGGMRSLGCGKFSVDWKSPGKEWESLLEPKNGSKSWCLLSLTHPAEEERGNPLEDASFELVTRDGWAASPFTFQQVKRKSCKMFIEGSVLPYQLAGCMADVTPSIWDKDLHPLYRYGYAVSVPVEVTGS